MLEEKRALRIEARSELRGLSDAEIRCSDAAIQRRLMDSALYQCAQSVFCYYSIDREISTWEILADAADRGKTVALPVSSDCGEMEFFRYTGNLQTGIYGIPEPCGREQLVPEKTDVILVPGLCFDRRGYRLGKGGGYYDRYLAAHRGITIGLCRDRFFRDVLPRSWNDLPVEYVVTETETIDSKSGTSEEVPQADA